jgi:hypothetical protein
VGRYRIYGWLGLHTQIHTNYEARMFIHNKDLELKVRVGVPDPRFASLLMEQFGGANGELTAA